MKQVFITGAAGFIGGYIVNQFIEEGWHVLALVHRNSSPSLDDLSNKGLATILCGDLKNMPPIEKKLAEATLHQSIDVIVHCAGRASDIGSQCEFRKTNYDSVRELVRISKTMNVQRFVFISTTDVYGLCDFHGESEDELPLKARPNNPYPKFKISAEKLIRAELPPDRFSIIRPAQVWGVGDQTLTPRIIAFLSGSPWIVHFGKWKGRNRWPLAHVRNVALTTYLAAIDQIFSGQAVNVVDEEQTSMDEFYRILARLYFPHKKFKTVTIPFWIGQGFAFFVSWISNRLYLAKPFADPSFYALYAVSHHLDFSNDRMKTLFERSNRSWVTRTEGINEIASSSNHWETGS